MPRSRPIVDTASGESVSFAPLSPRRTSPIDAWPPVVIGAGRSMPGSFSHGALGDAMTVYPIQPAKVQRPSLRDDTLARERLLDWLAAKVHHRIILVLADAGYGKTTLLADFSQRTRVRTLWYRLDADDRDWLSFIGHLVAAGREHDPDFAPATAELLGDLSAGGPTRETALGTFIRELPSIGGQGALLILDDFHLVDDSPDIRLIARELVARAPERLSIAFVSRRAPAIPLARLRASGEIAELGTDDLRFDAAETARLFKETYGRDLEPDVLADVRARTEGWAASLQLVHAALRDRTPAEIRRFIRGLTGADQELYDYLAEEVVGDLPDDLQRFLMCTSLLQIVTPELAAVVTDLDAPEVARLTAAAERLTLLSRSSRTSRHQQRFHPLVREFLEARLRSASSDEAVSALHLQVARATAIDDWRTAAYHYREAGDHAAVSTTIANAIPEIMGSGAYAVAGEFIDGAPPDFRHTAFGVVTSRIRMQEGDYEGAIEEVQRVLSGEPIPAERDHALLNLLTLQINAGHRSQALDLANTLKDTTSDPNLRLIAEAARLSVLAASADGNLDQVSAHFRLMAERQRLGHRHHFAVTMLNLGLISVLQDRPLDALTQLDEAAEAFAMTSASIEISSMYVLRAAVLAQLGRRHEAEALLSQALSRPDLRTEPDLVLEAAEFEDSFGEPSRATALLAEADGRLDLSPKHLWFRSLISARAEVRRRHYGKAQELLRQISQTESTSPGLGIARDVDEAYLAVATDRPNASTLAQQAARQARKQRAHRSRRLAELLVHLSIPTDGLSSYVRALATEAPWHLAYLSDLIVRRMPDLDTSALESVKSVLPMHPGRWRHALRMELESAPAEKRLAIGRLLETIGEHEDVRRLRDAGRGLRRMPGAADLGRRLSRRLAQQVMVEDLGRISVRVGPESIVGTSIRRRVLALLTFLLSRPDFACTRDQVLEALWPELEPDAALNSLNQTIYFLRRVFEEDFDDDVSPGYVHHESELIWLDPELVFSRSSQCGSMIRRMPPDPEPADVVALSEAYTGRFALDFEYEDWAATFRDWLHASYLQIVERAVAADLNSGHFDRGIKIARRALEVAPEADSVEVSLLRLYRASGAHAAAAEQYAHYADRLRSELDMDAAPLEAI